MTNWLHGLHDVDGAALMGDKPGWLVVTEAIGCDPNDHSGANYYAWTSRGYSVIVRLNNGYAPAGTIPAPDKYGDFAQRCANFVGASPGVNLVIIGNEPNHSNEWPNGQKIDPAGYGHCYAGCKQAIHTVKRDCKVLVAGCAPWNNEAGMDWLDYWKIVINNVYPCDGFAIHAYTHGADPSLIHSDEKVNNWYWHFRTYRDQLAALPLAARSLPVYITESDQGDDAWADANSGWVQNAYAEIDAWNKSNTPTIRALCLYCTHKRDRWYIMDKAGVQADFRAAVGRGYTSPVMGATTMPDSTFIPAVSTGTQVPTLPPRQVDPAAALRGVKVETPNVAPGQKFWFAKNIKWLNEQESQGRHHILGNVYKDGAKQSGVPLIVNWPSGSARILTEDKSKDLPPFDYWYNYPMSPSLNEYNVKVDGAPSETVKGIGMGADGNSHIHTSTVIEWELATMTQDPTKPPSQPTKPSVPPITGGGLLWPVQGPITQYFGAHDIAYPGSPGHDGLDFGVPEGTPVLAVADGKVMYVAEDAGGFGLYVRIYHPAYGFHSFMGHLSQQLVTPGQMVKQGQKVALSGNTGNSTGPHLHFSTRLGSETAYYDLHDGYHSGQANPLAVYALINIRTPTP